MGHWIFVVLLGFAGTKGISSVGPAIRDCESYEIMKCLQSTQNEAQLFFPDTQQKLREYCRHLMAGLDCAKSLIEHCVSKSEREMYHNLTRDMVGMNEVLCTPNSPLSTRFLKHVDCYKSLSDRFQVCSDRYIGNIMVVRSLGQDEQVGMTCCTVQEYDRCMRNAVEGRCDRDAESLVQDTVGTSLRQFVNQCKTLGGDLPTSNCMKRYAPGSSHETSNLNDSGAAQAWAPVHLLFLLCLLVLSMT